MSRSSSRTRAYAKAASAFACLLAVTGLPQAAMAQERPQEFTKQDRKNRGKADEIIEAAHRQGVAILVVATLSMDYKYPSPAILNDNLADEVTDKGSSAAIEYSMAAEWVNVANPDSVVVVAQHVSLYEIGASGWVYRQRIGNNDYLIFAVEPGTYSLSKISYPRPRSKLGAGYAIASGTGAASIGELRQVASSMFEAEQTMVYRDAVTTTVEASEECNWWYKGVCTQPVYTPEHTEQTSAAGYYPQTDYLPTPAIDVGIKLTGDVASFQVEAGEVILVDGLFPQPLDTDMGVADCRNGESMHVCALKSLELIRAKGSVEQLRAFDFAAKLYPRLGGLMANAQYRSLKLNATTFGESKFGERYRFSR
jgi:hypothetical protein